jgi:hypothetical protein
MEPRSWGERELRRRVMCAELWNEFDPDPKYALDWARKVDEVRIGNFILDMLAPNADGGLTIVEFKVVMSKDTLAQLLLYPRALRCALKQAKAPVPDIRMLLVTTHLDKGVVDVLDALNPAPPVFFRLCVKKGDQLALVDPRTLGDEPHNQYYDQVEAYSWKTVFTWTGSELHAKGQLLWTLDPQLRSSSRT